MNKIDLVTALEILRTASDPHAQAVIETTIAELERLQSLEEAAVKLTRLYLDEKIMDRDLAERILALAEQDQ